MFILSLLLPLLLHFCGIEANSSAFREVLTNVTKLTENSYIVTKEIKVTNLLQCALTSNMEMNLEDSGVICYNDTRCFFSDCPYKLVTGSDTSDWNCYGLEIIDRYAVTTYKADDGMYYFSGPDRTYDYAKAVEYCEQVPGFSLPIIITRAQYEVAKRNLISGNSNLDDYWVGLAKHPSGTGFYWPAVGLNFEITKLNTGEDVVVDDVRDDVMFHFTSGQFHDRTTDRQIRVLCQGNLENLDWTTEILN